MHQKSSIILK